MQRLPPGADARRSLVRKARVLAQVHGALFLHLRSRTRRSSSNLDRVVLRMLVHCGPKARAVVAKHRLYRGLPLALLGGLPLWDRVRPSGELDTADRASLRLMARGIRSLVVSSAASRTTVLVVEPGSLRDPLVKELVSELMRALGDGREHGRGGLLLLLPEDAADDARLREGDGKPTLRCNRAIGIARSSLPRPPDPPLAARPARRAVLRCR